MVATAATETATVIDARTLFVKDVSFRRFLISSRARLQSVTTAMTTRGQEVDEITGLFTSTYMPV